MCLGVRICVSACVCLVCACVSVSVCVCVRVCAAVEGPCEHVRVPLGTPRMYPCAVAPGPRVCTTLRCHLPWARVPRPLDSPSASAPTTICICVWWSCRAPPSPSSPSPSVGSTGRPWRSLRNALDLGTPRRALPRLPGPRPGHHGRRPKCSVCARALFLPPLGASWHPCLALLPTLRALTNTCANSYRLYKNILHSRQWIHGQWMF